MINNQPRLAIQRWAARHPKFASPLWNCVACKVAIHAYACRKSQHMRSSLRSTTFRVTGSKPPQIFIPSVLEKIHVPFAFCTSRGKNEMALRLSPHACMHALSFVDIEMRSFTTPHAPKVCPPVPTHCCAQHELQAPTVKPAPPQGPPCSPHDCMDAEKDEINRVNGSHHNILSGRESRKQAGGLVA
jgi:hypothetical protein